jgi:hypothetical protein
VHAAEPEWYVRPKPRGDDKLVELVGLEPIQISQEGGRLDARGPHDEFSWKQRAIGEAHPVLSHLGDSHTGMNLHGERVQ